MRDLRSAPTQRAITDEEHEALNLLVMGLNREVIARRLSRSIRHVHRLIASVKAKVGVRNELQLAIAAYRLGLLRPGTYLLEPPASPDAALPTPTPRNAGLPLGAADDG